MKSSTVLYLVYSQPQINCTFNIKIITSFEIENSVTKHIKIFIGIYDKTIGISYNE